MLLLPGGRSEPNRRMARFADAAQAEPSSLPIGSGGGRKTGAKGRKVSILGGIKNRKPLNAGAYLPFNSSNCSM
jgi:hypothetical protein